MIVIIAMLWLKMVQDDRQWQKFNEIQLAIDQQTKDVTGLRKLISEGGIVTHNNGQQNPSSTKPQDLFRRMRDVHNMDDYAQGGTIVESFQSAPPTPELPDSAGHVFARDLLPRAGIPGRIRYR